MYYIISQVILFLIIRVQINVSNIKILNIKLKTYGVKRFRYETISYSVDRTSNPSIHQNSGHQSNIPTTRN